MHADHEDKKVKNYNHMTESSRLKKRDIWSTLFSQEFNTIQIHLTFVTSPLYVRFVS